MQATRMGRADRCSECGTPVPEGHDLRLACGELVTATKPITPAQTDGLEPGAGAREKAPPDLPAGWSYAPGPPSGEGPSGPGSPRGKSTTVWIATAATVIVAAVVSILVFVVFHDDIFGGGETGSHGEGAATATTIATSQTDHSRASASTVTAPSDGTSGVSVQTAAGTPEEAVLLLLLALENKDFGALLALVDPVALETMVEDLPSEAAQESAAGLLFDYASVKFSGIELATEMTSDTTATVMIVAGIATLVDTQGTSDTEDVTEATEPVALDLVMRDGSWYLDPASLLGIDLGEEVID